MTVRFLNISGGGTGGAGLNIKQIVKTGVVTGQTIEIPINYTTDFKIIGITGVWKFVPGTQNQVTVLNGFDNSEADSFLPNPFAIFDGNMRLKTTFLLTASTSTLGVGKMFVVELDRNPYKTLESLEVT